VNKRRIAAPIQQPAIDRQIPTNHRTPLRKGARQEVAEVRQVVRLLDQRSNNNHPIIFVKKTRSLAETARICDGAELVVAPTDGGHKRPLAEEKGREHGCGGRFGKLINAAPAGRADQSLYHMKKVQHSHSYHAQLDLRH
jgi:hypothetical protein